MGLLRRIFGVTELAREVDALSVRLRVVEGDLAALRSRFNRAAEDAEIVLPVGIPGSKDRLS